MVPRPEQGSFVLRGLCRINHLVVGSDADQQRVGWLTLAAVVRGSSLANPPDIVCPYGETSSRLPRSGRFRALLRE